MSKKKCDIISLVCSLVLPMVIILGVMYVLGIMPFGNKTVFMWDAKLQHKDYLGYVWDILHGNSSVQYSATKSLGGGIPGILGFYASSPLNVLLIFFDKQSIPLFMSLIIVLRVGLCGLTSSIYLRKRFQISNLVCIALSTAYAMMEYNIFYCRNCMWLDGVIILPLVALAIWRIMNRKSAVMLWGWIAVSIISNWYTGYMVCYMSVLIFIVENIISSDFDLKLSIKERLKITGTYFIGLFGGVATSAFALLPALAALVTGKATSYRTLFSDVINFDFIHFFSGFDICAPVNKSTAPVIYCTYLVMVCGVYFFFNSNIKLRSKLGLGLLTVFLMASFCFREFELTWTGFVESASYYFRFSFVFSFVMIFMAAYVFSSIGINGIDKKAVWESAGLIFGGICVLKRSGEIYSSGRAALGSIVLIIVYLIMLRIDFGKNRRLQLVCMMVLCFLVAGESFYNAKLAFREYNETGDLYTEYVDEMEQLVSDVNDLTGSEFYRFETCVSYNKLTGREVASCESMLFNFASVEHYSSAYDINVDKFMSAMGCSDWLNGTRQYYCETYWNSPMIVTDSLFSTKYILWNAETWGYEKIKESPLSVASEVNLYENSYSLPLGYNVDSDMGDLEYVENPFENQNMLLESMTGHEENVYEKVKANFDNLDTKEHIETWTLTAPGNGPVYVYAIHPGYNTAKCTISVNGEKVQNICNRFLQNAVYIGEYKAGDEIQVSISREDKSSQNHIIYAAQLNTDIFENAIEELKNGYTCSLQVDKNKISGSYESDEDTTVLLTIPYEDNWKIYVDGEKVEGRMLANVFIGIDLTAGKHEISMTYTAPGVKTGVAVTVVSFVVLVLYIVVWKRRNSRCEEFNQG